MELTRRLTGREFIYIPGGQCESQTPSFSARACSRSGSPRRSHGLLGPVSRVMPLSTSRAKGKSGERGNGDRQRGNSNISVGKQTFPNERDVKGNTEFSLRGDTSSSLSKVSGLSILYFLVGRAMNFQHILSKLLSVYHK